MSGAPVVFLHGEESFLIDRELRLIENECGITSPEDLNRQVFDGAETSPGDVVSSAKTLPFMGGSRLIIVKNAGAWNADQWEAVTPYLVNPNPTTVLVFIAEKEVDKRRAYWKTLKKNARMVECPRPADAELPGWIRKMASSAGFELDQSVAQSLVLRVGPDLQLLWREILKLHAFAGDGGRVTIEDVEKLVGESRGTTVFVLCDALGSRKLKESMKALQRLLELDEPPVKLVYMIARHFRILTRARQVRDEGRLSPAQAASVIGVPPFVVKKSMEQASRWSPERLNQAFRELLHADLMLKSGGSTEVIEHLVISLCKG